MKKVLASIIIFVLLVSLFSAFAIVGNAVETSVLISNFEVGSATFDVAGTSGEVTVDTIDKYEGAQSSKLKILNEEGGSSITNYILNKSVNAGASGEYLTFWAKSTVAFKMKVTLSDDSWGAGKEKIIDISVGKYLYSIPVSEMTVGTFNGTLRCIVLRIDYQFAGQPIVDGNMSIDAFQFTSTNLSANLNPMPVLISNFEEGSSTFTTTDPNGAVTVDTTDKYDGSQSAKLKIYNNNGSNSITQYILNKSVVFQYIESSKYLTFWAKSTDSFKMKVTIADDSWGAGLEKIIDIAVGTYVYSIPLSEMTVGTFNGTLRCIILRIDYQYEGQSEVNGFMNVDALQFSPSDLSADLTPRPLLISDFEEGSAAFTTIDPNGSTAVDTSVKYDGIQSEKLKIYNKNGSYSITQYLLNRNMFVGFNGVYFTFWAKSNVSFKMKITLGDDEWVNNISKIIDIYAGTYMYSIPLSDMTGEFNGKLRCVVLRIDYAYDGQPDVNGFMNIDNVGFTPIDMSLEIEKVDSPSETSSALSSESNSNPDSPSTNDNVLFYIIVLTVIVSTSLIITKRRKFKRNL